jgi:hypothetical protein
MRIGTETGSVINSIMATGSQKTPEIGMGATVICWSDRKAGTIISVSEKEFAIQEDYSQRSDSNGMSDSQSYSYTPNSMGYVWTFKRVSRGKAKGQWRENGVKDGYGVRIGTRDQYYDFSF